MKKRKTLIVLLASAGITGAAATGAVAMNEHHQEHHRGHFAYNNKKEHNHKKGAFKHSGREDFTKILAAKLNVDQNKLETALKEMRQEEQTQQENLFIQTLAKNLNVEETVIADALKTLKTENKKEDKEPWNNKEEKDNRLALQDKENQNENSHEDRQTPWQGGKQGKEGRQEQEYMYGQGQEQTPGQEGKQGKEREQEDRQQQKDSHGQKLEQDQGFRQEHNKIKAFNGDFSKKIVNVIILKTGKTEKEVREALSKTTQELRAQREQVSPAPQSFSEKLAGKLGLDSGLVAKALEEIKTK